MKKERRKKSYNVKTMEEKRGLIKKETGTDPDAIFLKSIFICKFLSSYSTAGPLDTLKGVWDD